MKPVAVVGAGYWGQNLVRVFAELKALAAVCETNLETLARLQQTYPSVQVTASFPDVLRNPSIAGVVIATPAESHFRMAREALLAGKHVFVEKPLALTLAEGQELVRLAERHGRILMVGHLLEYHPAVQKLKALMDEGALGKVQYIYSNRLNLGRFRTEENILWSFAPHDLSVIQLLLDEAPVEVSTHGAGYLHREIADVTVTTMSFASGVCAHIFVSWLHPYKEQRLVVVGDRKMAVFNDAAEQDKLVLYHHQIEWVNRVPVAHKVPAEPVPVDSTEPLTIECQHFLDCLESGRAPRTDGANGLRVLEILEACQTSLAQHGQPVALRGSFGQRYFAHPTAVVDEPAQIGAGTKIWHFSHVMTGARVGRDCTIGQNVLIASDAVVGDRVKIQNNVSVYTGVTLEDEVFCGPSVVFTNVFNPRSAVSRKHEFRPTRVKRGSTLGANSTILCGLTIGQHAFVGAGAVVTHDIPDYGLAYGSPARLTGWMCACGVKLRFRGASARCQTCGKTYRKQRQRVQLAAAR